MRNAVLREAPSQDALRVGVVPCTSAIRPLPAFSIGHHPAHNFLVKRVCCRFAQVIGIVNDPSATFPYQTGDGITPLKVPSTSWRDVPSVIISVGNPIKPS